MNSWCKGVQHIPQLYAKHFAQAACPVLHTERQITLVQCRRQTSAAADHECAVPQVGFDVFGIDLVARGSQHLPADMTIHQL